MSYSPQFEKEYEDGWEDFPSEDTLITAHSLNMYDGTFEHIEDYLEDHPIAQTATMPTASEDELGNIYQYMGETTATFTEGYFYKCVSDGEDPATYSWQNINVQSGGGGGASALSDLTDVSIVSPTDGEGFIYDGSNQKWKNGNAPSALTNDYWSNSTTYAVGDIVIYLNGLYRCKVANTGQTPTDTAYWEAISLTDIAQPKLIANTDFITMESGFTLLNTQIYKQGYRVFGDICVKKSTAYGSTTVTAGTIKSGYLPKVGILPMCMLGTDEWAQQGVGYCYIGTSGSLLFGDQNNTGNKKAAKVHIDYMTA